MKLEKIEFGGIKGKQLSTQVEGMFVEFQGLYKVKDLLANFYPLYASLIWESNRGLRVRAFAS